MKHLRKLLVVATLGTFFSISNPLMAQTFEVGVRDGVSLSWLAGIENTRPLAGFYAGLTGDLYLGDHWGVGLDITLSEQGVVCNENGDGVEISYHYDYLNIPLSLTYRVAVDEKNILQFMAGGQVGAFLLGKYAYTAPSVTNDGFVSGEDWLDSESFHPYDFGVLVGLQWNVGNTAVEVRYTLGITQTHNGISNTIGDRYYISIPDNRNSVLQIGTVFRF